MLWAEFETEVLTIRDALADVPGIKLRVAKIRPGRREGVETEIHRDLTTLARNSAWKQSTDTIRHQYVTGVQVTLGQPDVTPARMVDRCLKLAARELHCDLRRVTDGDGSVRGQLKAAKE